MSFSPKLPINSSWKSTIENAFQLFRRIKFIVEEDFSFGDFDPQTNYNGMTATAYTLYRARYIKIGKLFFFSFNALATLAAPFSNNILVTIPFSARGNSTSGDRQQGGGAAVSNAGAGEAAFWTIITGTNTLIFHRVNDGNWAAGSAEIVCNGFIEVN